MKNPASWKYTAARRLYLVLVFPLVVLIVFIMSIATQTYELIGPTYREVKQSLGFTYTNIKSVWENPIK